MTNPTINLEPLEEAMELITEGTRSHVRRLMKNYDGYVGHPSNWTGRYTRSDRYASHDTGLLLGRLWVCFAHTGDEEFKDLALRIIKPITCDLTEQPIRSLESGSEIFFGLCMGAEIIGSNELHDLAVQASRNLVANLWSGRLGRFLPWQGYDEREVPLEWGGLLYHLAWTSHAVPHHLDYFIRHQESVLHAGLVRADGSTAQIAHLDENGRAERFQTMQGWRPDSTWTRGQTWAMHNFIAVSRCSGRSDLEDIAHRVVGWWLDHVPADWVPFYDFDDPDRDGLPRDSCAAAMSVSALLSYVPKTGDAARVSRIVDGTLTELCRNYLSLGGLLLHSSVGRVVRLYGMTQDREPPGHGGSGVPTRFPQEDIMPYGNYFIAETLHRRLRGDRDFPKLLPSKW